MLKACKAVAARHGLVVEARDIIGVDLRWGFGATFRVPIPLPDGTALDSERLRFEALAEAFGLSPGDYGRQFTTGREIFRITGIDPRRPKYPVSAERNLTNQPYTVSLLRRRCCLALGERHVECSR